MAWTTFPTLTDGQILTGAHMIIVRDNFAETAPAKFTAAGQFFAATGLNAGAARSPSGTYYTGGGTDVTNSAGYIALTGGAAVTVTTGIQAFVGVHMVASSNTAGGRSWGGYAISGATTQAASDGRAVMVFSPAMNNDGAVGAMFHNGSLTPGSNVFTNHFRVTGGTSSFPVRSVHVIPF